MCFLNESEVMHAGKNQGASTNHTKIKVVHLRTKVGDLTKPKVGDIYDVVVLKNLQRLILTGITRRTIISHN